MDYITDEKELKNAEGITAIYFYAQWMPFHKKMKIMIEKVQKIYDVKFYAVDTDSFPGLAKRFNVTSIPEVVITTTGGEEINRIKGIVMTTAFKSTFFKIFHPKKENNVKLRK